MAVPQPKQGQYGERSSVARAVGAADPEYHRKVGLPEHWYPLCKQRISEQALQNGPMLLLTHRCPCILFSMFPVML